MSMITMSVFAWNNVIGFISIRISVEALHNTARVFLLQPEYKYWIFLINCLASVDNMFETIRLLSFKFTLKYGEI